MEKSSLFVRYEPTVSGSKVNRKVQSSLHDRTSLGRCEGSRVQKIGAVIWGRLKHDMTLGRVRLS